MNFEGAPFANRISKLPHFGTASCLISRTSAIPHDSADRGWSEARLEHSPLDAAFTLRSALEPILDGLPTGALARLPDVAIPAGRTRACRCRAFVSYPSSCAPAVHHAAAGNRGVTATPHPSAAAAGPMPERVTANRIVNILMRCSSRTPAG